MPLEDGSSLGIGPWGGKANRLGTDRCRLTICCTGDASSNVMDVLSVCSSSCSSCRVRIRLPVEPEFPVEADAPRGADPLLDTTAGHIAPPRRGAEAPCDESDDSPNVDNELFVDGAAKGSP